MGRHKMKGRTDYYENVEINKLKENLFKEKAAKLHDELLEMNEVNSGLKAAIENQDLDDQKRMEELRKENIEIRKENEKIRKENEKIRKEKKNYFIEIRKENVLLKKELYETKEEKENEIAL